MKRRKRSVFTTIMKSETRSYLFLDLNVSMLTDAYRWLIVNYLLIASRQIRRVESSSAAYKRPA